MAQDESFSVVPDAPLNRNEESQNFEKASQSHEEDPHFVPLILPTLHLHIDRFPNLSLQPYHLKKSNRATNVLALIHNTAKREIVDLITVVIPTIQQYAQVTGYNAPIFSAPFGEGLQKWWKTLLKIFFFVAETDDDIANLILPPACKTLKRLNDLKQLNALQKTRKSLQDRYSFTMEVVFRAADRALQDFETASHSDKLDKLIEKFFSVASLMLESMQVAYTMAEDIEDICDLELSSLESTVVDALSKYSKADRPLFMFIFSRWMHEESYIKQWISKHAGIRGRLFFDNWKRIHEDRQLAVIEDLKKYIGL